MVNNEKENVGIAGVASRLSDEVSDHFSLQIPAECKRTGYIYKIKDEIYSGKKGTIPGLALVNGYININIISIL